MRLFTYGTLCFGAVIRRVCGREPPSRDARLPGYACFYMRAGDYPGLLEMPGRQTLGRLYQGLSEHELSRLDRYEGTEYRRLRLTVEDDQGQPETAWVYLPRRRAQVSARPWSAERFASQDLRRWLRSPRNGL